MSAPVDAYLNGLSQGASRTTTLYSLEQVARFFGATAATLAWHELRYEQVQELRTWLIGRYKPRTTNKALAALRGVLKAAWRLGLMSTDDYHRAIDVRAARVSDPPAGRMLTLAELRRLVNAGGSLRDAAIIALFYAAGLRREEVTLLKCGSYDRQTGRLTVRGKGGKIRQVLIAVDWRPPVESWLDSYRGRPDDVMFPSHHSSALASGKTPLSKSGLVDIVEKRRLLAAVAPFSTHDLRRTFITNLIELGVDLVVVQRIAGHDNINTTAHYDRRSSKAEDDAIARLSGPKEK